MIDKIIEFYNKYKDDRYPISPDITKYCIYSSTFIIIEAIVAFFYNYNLLSVLLFCLYISSYIYWNKPAIMSISKLVDHFFVVLVLSYITYLTFSLTKKLRKIIFIFLFCIGTIGVINLILFNFKILKQSNNNYNTKGIHEKEGLDNEKKFNYFTLDYTYPGTYEREEASRYNIFIHCCCIHILPCLIGIYCIILNPL